MDEEYNIEYNTTFSPALIAVIVALIIFYMICIWRIYTKAGKLGWAALIPIFNIYVLLKIVGKPGWWLLLMFIPLVNFIYAIWTCNMLSKSFGKDEGFTVGLLLLSVIFFPILVFGNAKYRGPYGDKIAYAAYQSKNVFEFENKNG